jgi:hypothetical protein
MSRLLGRRTFAPSRRRTIEFDEVRRLTTIPKLAWSLSLTSHALTVGSDVDVEGGTCFEGGRSGPLGEACLFGSGVVRTADGYVGYPPSHMLDGLYFVARHRGGATVTNSLVWALRTAGITRADAKLIGFAARNVMSATEGILGYKRLILTTRAASVFQLLYIPFVVDATTYRERPVDLLPGGPRLTFDRYKEGLVEVIRGTLRHSPRYPRLVSSCSSGYDSAACTALGKEVGLDLALTIRTARGGREDSGEHVASEMGVPVKAYDRLRDGAERYNETIKDWFVDVATLSEVAVEDLSEFVAPLANPGDVLFKPFEPQLPGAVLLTGFHGAAVWQLNALRGPWIRRSDATGSALNEYRLRVGFVHLPAPYILARRVLAIEAISQSDAMRPWRHGNPYNRPIARRLAEEAGASRESFGIAKRAANPMIEVGPAGMAEAYERIAERYV